MHRKAGRLPQRSRPVLYVPQARRACAGLLVAEVALEESFEAAAVTGLVAGHFVHGVVDGVEVQLLGALGDAGLVLTGAALGVHTLLEVGLRVPYHIAEQFGELRSVLGLFPGIALEGLGYFGITLAVGLAAHGQIHAHLGALAHEVVVEVFDHFLVAALGHADFVLGHEGETALLGEFLELGGGNAAHGALFGCVVAFVNVTANGADEFLFHDVGIFKLLFLISGLFFGNTGLTLPAVGATAANHELDLLHGKAFGQPGQFFGPVGRPAQVEDATATAAQEVGMRAQIGVEAGATLAHGQLPNGPALHEQAQRVVDGGLGECGHGRGQRGMYLLGRGVRVVGAQIVHHGHALH